MERRGRHDASSPPPPFPDMEGGGGEPSSLGDPVGKERKGKESGKEEGGEGG